MATVNPIYASLNPLPVTHPEFKRQLLLILDQLIDYTGAETNVINSIITRETYPWPQSVEQKTDDALLFNTVHNEFEFNAVVKEADYYALDGEFINASNGARIYFPSSPSLNSRVRIRNDDGSSIKFDGNGKFIGGYTGGYIDVQEEVRDFQYFIEQDKWFQVMAYQPQERILFHQISNLLEAILEEIKKQSEAKQ